MLATHTPLQEALAQFMFWGSMVCLPFSIALFVVAFPLRSPAQRIVMMAVGGLLLTQFLWYFVYLGIGLSDKLGTMHAPAWWQFAPLGFGIALCLTMMAELRRPSRIPPESSKR